MNKTSTRRERIAALAEVFGWRRFYRLGKELWYDPAGGHVSWEELPAAIEGEITELITECKDKPLRSDDAAVEPRAVQQKLLEQHNSRPKSQDFATGTNANKGHK